MKIYLYAVFFLLVLSCGDERTKEEIIPDQYIVISNDLGLRGDFIDQANIITFVDSQIVVESVQDPNFSRTYPVNDSSIVHGSGAQWWTLRRVGPDTLRLYDPEEDNWHTLLKLRRVDSIPQLDEMIRGREVGWRVIGATAGLEASHVATFYLDDGSGNAGCLVTRNYYPRQIRIAVEGQATRYEQGPMELVEARPVSYRVDYRFNQPMIAMSRGGGNHEVMLLDTFIASERSIAGRRMDTRSFGEPRELMLARAAIDTSLLLSSVAEYTNNPQPLETASASDRAMRSRFNSSGMEAKREISVHAFEADQLTLELLPNDYYQITTPDRPIARGQLEIHPHAPYLLVGSGCNLDDYFHYTMRSDSLMITVPIRVVLPISENAASAAPGLANSVRYTYEEFNTIIPPPARNPR